MLHCKKRILSSPTNKNTYVDKIGGIFRLDRDLCTLGNNYIFEFDCLEILGFDWFFTCSGYPLIMAL